MRSFKNYTPNQVSSNTTQGATKNDNAQDMENFAKQMLGQYEGKSGMEMFRTLLKQAEASKRAGTLTNEQIDEFYMQFSPMLNAIQRKKLEEIIADLKQL